jgi:DNA-binding NarL/FixJ family response regulator
MGGGGLGPAVRGSGMPRQVLICDDHEVLRHGLRAVFRQAPDLTVVAEAVDADEALSLAASTRPDVVLVGLGAQGSSVQGLVRGLTGMGIPVVLLSETDHADDLMEALQAGARGCVHTTVSPTRLLEGVRAVARGETVLDACVAGELLHRLDGTRPVGDGHGRSGPGQLTARQLKVAELVAEGLSNAEIAARLRVSRATVKGHITVALRRLGLRDRTQLAIHVHRAGRPTERGEGRPSSG